PCTERHCFSCTLAYRRPPQWWRHFGLLEAAIRHIDVFVAPTQFSKRMHQQLGLKAPIVHLPLFVPHGAVEDPVPGRLSDELRDFPRQPYFLFVGRLEKLKGLQTLIPIFRRYQKAQLWVAGEGAYEPYLRRLAAGSDNIRFLGRRTGNDLQALYREARAVIVPSICFEVFSLVVIEAFRHQTPVIVRNIGGMPEIVQEAGGGYVYDNDDELLSAMDQVLHQPSHRRNLGLNGYAAYLEKWTADAHLKSYFALIGQIAAARSEFSVERQALLSSGVS
ncbi:MAG TPA: glycosyltransferase family 4 protein, partial [Candidatus Binatia bacterium]|nr:glycosyltransferase family 4 protein [Candidatus Binatia bacterium]